MFACVPCAGQKSNTPVPREFSPICKTHKLSGSVWNFLLSSPTSRSFFFRAFSRIACHSGALQFKPGSCFSAINANMNLRSLRFVSILFFASAALNQTQKDALIVNFVHFFYLNTSQYIGVCSATSNFICSSNVFDSCNADILCDTNDDLVKFGPFTGLTSTGLTIPTELNLFPTLIAMCDLASLCASLCSILMCSDINGLMLRGTIPTFDALANLERL